MLSRIHNAILNSSVNTIIDTMKMSAPISTQLQRNNVTLLQTPRLPTFHVQAQHRNSVSINNRNNSKCFLDNKKVPILSGAPTDFKLGKCYCSKAHSASIQDTRETKAIKEPVEAENDALMSQTPTITLPTMLTLARIASIPLLIAAWFWPSPLSAPLVTGVFVLASITDWLDGYLARKLKQHSPFGAFLDPVADKLMVAAVLIILGTQPVAGGLLAGNVWLIPVCSLAIIGREISMSGLREWAALSGPEAARAVAVNQLGKWKTATQMVSLSLLLACKDLRGVAELVAADGSSSSAVTLGFLERATDAGLALLVVSSGLAILSATVYGRALGRHFAAAGKKK